MNEKMVKALGSIAAVAAIIMYVSYIPQIIGNLHGNRGDYIQPLAAAINCILWVGYGLLKKRTRLAYCHCQFARRGIWIDGFPDSIDSFLKRNRTKEPAIYREKKDNEKLDRKKSSC